MTEALQGQLTNVKHCDGQKEKKKKTKEKTGNQEAKGVHTAAYCGHVQ